MQLDIKDLVEIANAAIRLHTVDAQGYAEISTPEVDKAWKNLTNAVQRLEASGYKGHLSSWKDDLNQVLSATGLFPQ